MRIQNYIQTNNDHLAPFAASLDKSIIKIFPMVFTDKRLVVKAESGTSLCLMMQIKGGSHTESKQAFQHIPYII